MNGSSIKSGSAASLALRMARGALWSAFMTAAVVGVLVAAVLLTQYAVADRWRLIPPAAFADDRVDAPGATTERAPNMDGVTEAESALPRPIIVDVVPLTGDQALTPSP